MTFNDTKPIYLQIADALCDRILSNSYSADERIPSVRELAISISVNPNTVARSYEFLQNSGVIYNKRGIGYFVAQDARELIIQTQKKEFLNEQLPNIIKTMKLLGITPDIIEDNFNNYKL